MRGSPQILFAIILAYSVSLVISSTTKTLTRDRRGAAYAGPHPGSGHGQYSEGGVGIPGLNNAIQYAAYSKLLNSGHRQSSGYGGGHGRKVTVDEAIGLYGHHTLSRSYPYTAGHGQSAPGYYGPTHGHGGGGGGHSSHGSSRSNSGYGH